VAQNWAEKFVNALENLMADRKKNGLKLGQKWPKFGPKNL
jgi:hypothetical protein